ncbi:MAG: hypothetical protein ACYS8X_05570 [Planctomycetota bacterium]|jgi:hypothetical protein
MGRMKKVLVVLGVLAASFAGGMGGHWAAGPSMAQAKEAAKQNYVDAEGFRVVDADGKVRAALTVANDGAVKLEMLDAKGQSRLAVGLDADGISSMAMADGDGSIRWKAGLVTAEDGETLAGALALQLVDARTLRIGDLQGNHRGVFRVTPEGPFLLLMDQKGKPVATMGVHDEDHSAGFGVQDSKGNERVHVGITNDGSTSLVMRDTMRKARTVLGVSKAGNAELIILDKVGDERILLKLKKDGSGRLYFLDDAGKPVAELPAVADKEDPPPAEE